MADAKEKASRHGGNHGIPFYLHPEQGAPEYDQGHSVVVWYDDLVLLNERAEAAEKALRLLMKESAAVLALAEPELRETVGHTNVAVFKLRIEEAGALLRGRNARMSPV